MPQPFQSTLSYTSDELVEASKKHVGFLRDLHKLGVTIKRFHRYSVKRYIGFWLPLVARQLDDNGNNKQELIPPPDIGWLWHCHRLAPGDYEAFVTHAFGGKLVEAKPPFAFQQAQDERDATQLLWKEAFPSEPFFLTVQQDIDISSEIDVFRKKYFVGKHDLIASTKCQATFLWQVSGHRFSDDSFLQDGVRRYIQFLQITDNSLPLVPTYQIDLMWHTHMLLSTGRYNQDCINIRGGVFYHDDSLNDRSAGAKLDQSYRATMELWQDKYKELYRVKGGMYRGEPPATYWSSAWLLDFDCTVATEVLVAADAIEATSSSEVTSYAEGPDFIAYAKLPRGVNSNPIKDGDVFGDGRQGLGYYSLNENNRYIQDAYKILRKRLKKRIQYKESQTLGAGVVAAVVK